MQLTGHKVDCPCCAWARNFGNYTIGRRPGGPFLVYPLGVEGGFADYSSRDYSKAEAAYIKLNKRGYRPKPGHFCENPFYNG